MIIMMSSAITLVLKVIGSGLDFDNDLSDRFCL